MIHSHLYHRLLSNKIPTTLFLFSKKKPASQAPQQKSKSYNVNIDESKIPPHLRKIYNTKKQAYKMEVASQAELANEHLLRVTIKQREYQLEQDQEKKQSLNFFEKANIGLVFFNVATSVGLAMTNLKWLGMYSVMLLYPSTLITGAISIGINLGYLIMRQGLNMHTPLEKLEKIQLTKSPFSYSLQATLISIQLYWLSISNFSIKQIPLLCDLSPSTLSNMIGISALTLVLHFYYQKRDFPKKKLSSLHLYCFGLSLLTFLWVVQHYGQNQKFIEGKERYSKMWITERPKVKVGQKINE